MWQDWEETQEAGLFAPPFPAQQKAGSGRCARSRALLREEQTVLAVDVESGGRLVLEQGESLLQAMERANPVSATIGCRNGGCGVCRIQLLAGRVELGKMSRRYVTADMQRERYALACRVYPQGDIRYRLAPLDLRTC
jgi:ferredoxin